MTTTTKTAAMKAAARAIVESAWRLWGKGWERIDEQSRREAVAYQVLMTAIAPDSQATADDMRELYAAAIQEVANRA